MVNIIKNEAPLEIGSEIFISKFGGSPITLCLEITVALARFDISQPSYCCPSQLRPAAA
jgi:hypothetical protein